MSQPTANKFDRKIKKKTAIQIQTLEDMHDTYARQPDDQSMADKHQIVDKSTTGVNNVASASHRAGLEGKDVAQTGGERSSEVLQKSSGQIKTISPANSPGIVSPPKQAANKPAIVKADFTPQDGQDDFQLNQEVAGIDDSHPEVIDSFANDQSSEFSSPIAKHDFTTKRLAMGNEQQVTKVVSSNSGKGVANSAHSQVLPSNTSPKLPVTHSAQKKPLNIKADVNKVPEEGPRTAQVDNQESDGEIDDLQKSKSSQPPLQKGPPRAVGPPQRSIPQSAGNRHVPISSILPRQHANVPVKPQPDIESTTHIPQTSSFGGRQSSHGHHDHKVVNNSHSRLFPFKSTDTNELTSLLADITLHDQNYGLVNAVLPNKFTTLKNIFREAGDNTLSGILNIEDDWYHYYVEQFLVYTPASDFYEPWEMVVMALFNYQNKIFNTQAVGGLQSERFVDINPTKVLLDLVSGNFRSDDMFFLTFCYAVAKDCFHPDALDEIIENYLDSISSHPAVDSRLVMLCALHPRALLHQGVTSRILTGIAVDNEVMAVLAELLKGQIKFDNDSLCQSLWISLRLCDFCLRRQMVQSAEEYIRYIGSYRLSPQVANDTNFAQEFRRVRALYFEELEKDKKTGSNAIGQMFGFVKGFVNNTVSMATDTTASKSEEVTWDPVAKRWLINGQIPPDEEPEQNLAPAKPSGPPPIKRPPPQGAVNPDSQPKTAPGGKKTRFVAYKFSAK